MTTKTRVALFMALAIMAVFLCLIMLHHSRTQRYVVTVITILNAADDVDGQCYRSTPHQVSANQLAENLRRQAHTISALRKRLNDTWYPRSMADVQTALDSALHAHQQAYSAMAKWVVIHPGNPSIVQHDLQQARVNYRAAMLRLNGTPRPIISLTDRTVFGIYAMGERWEARRRWNDQTQTFLSDFDRILQEYYADQHDVQAGLTQVKNGAVDQEVISVFDDQAHRSMERVTRLRHLETPDWAKPLCDALVPIMVNAARECRCYSIYAKARFMYEGFRYSCYGDYGLYGYENFSPQPPNQTLLASGKQIAIANVKAMTKISKMVESLQVTSRANVDETVLRRRW